MKKYDVVVIGAGPAGWTAATDGRHLGLDVLLVDRGRRVGGGFAHTGTIPSKVLRELALARRRMARSAAGGSELRHPPADCSSAMQQSIEGILPTLEQMLASSSVEVRWGSASFVSPHELRISTPDAREIVCADKFIIASGSQPRRPEEMSFDGAVVCDSEAMLQTGTVPESLIVLGGGFVGCELACTYAALGSRVTLVDRRRRLLRMLDGEIGEVVFGAMEKLGIDLRLGESFEATRTSCEGGWKATVELGEGSVTADRVLVALGRAANTLSLGLENAGVAVDDHEWIKVDESFRTSAPHIYAAGDVTGTAGLGGTSAYQGRLAMRHAAGRPAMAPVELPIALYTIPEVAMIGLTEETCRELGLAHVVGKAMYSQAARTHIAGGEEGLLKLVARREDHAIVGVHIAGEQASELIQLATFLMAQRATLETLLDAPYAQPTLSELYRLAAMDAIAGC